MNKKNSSSSNKLKHGVYVVPIPIGSVLDISLRATDILKNCDLILAEDTRTTQELLSELEIQGGNRLISYHNFNEAEVSERILKKLQTENLSAALVSDAGTPAIHDPGTRIVRDAHNAGIPVFAIPGPSSVTAALSVSGISANRFYFGGFLPSSQNDRVKALGQAKSKGATLVFFESPHRLQEALEDILKIFGANHEMTVCKELTKSYENISLTTVQRAIDSLEVKPPKGEYVLVLRGVEEERLSENELKTKIQELLKEKKSAGDVLTELQPVSELSRKELYNLITKLKNEVEKV